MVKKILCMLVAIVLCFGLFAGCTEQEIIEEETEGMVVFHKPQWSEHHARAGVVELIHSENVIFECIIDNGYISDSTQIDKKIITIEYDSILGEEQENYFHISPYEVNSWGCSNNSYSINQAFIEIILKVDRNIVGYSLIKFYRIPELESISFNTVLIKSAIFPKIDGEYQKISKSQVKKLMKEIKNNEEKK